jgi:dTMP kinase
MQKGKFIVFEGVDGSGKSTQAEKCASFLFRMDKFFDVYLTREPTRHFKVLREELETKSHVENNAQEAMWFTEMFVRDRWNHVIHSILPFLSSGTHVVCDRFKYSTLAYQHAQGIDLEFLKSLHEKMVKPDLIFILVLPIDVAIERRGEGGDLFERNKSFQEKVGDIYGKMKTLLPDENIVVIDANKTKKEIEKEIQSHVASLF